MAKWFIYVKSTDRVIGFDRNLLQRPDIILINEEQAQRIIDRSDKRRRDTAEREQEKMVRTAIDRASQGSGAELMGTEFERPTPQIVDGPQRDVGMFPDPLAPAPPGMVQPIVAPPNIDPDLNPSTVDLADAIEQLGR